jgi:hypothetical protein
MATPTVAKPKCNEEVPAEDPTDVCDWPTELRTITARIVIDDKEVVEVNPELIVACTGDLIVWTLVNACTTCDPDTKMKIKIDKRQPYDFLDTDNCRFSDNLKRKEQGLAYCRVKAEGDADPRRYKYLISGRHKCDPEVEVRGRGIHLPPDGRKRRERKGR